MATGAIDQEAETNPTVSIPETTRVFVSGLPPKFTTDQLAAHFGSKFKVTDAHVLADRRIGFVGFVDNEAAQNATKHFNKTYVRMSKIAVDLARPVELSQSKDGQVVPLSQKRQQYGRTDQGVKRKRPQHDDGERVRGKPAQQDGDKIQEIDVQGLSDEVSAEAPAVQNPTDVDWLRGRTTRTLDLIDPDEIQIRQDDEPGEAAIETQINSQQNVQDDLNEEHLDTITKVPNARLFLRNLAFSITEQHLRQHFEQFGKVQEVCLSVLTHILALQCDDFLIGTAYANLHLM